MAIESLIETAAATNPAGPGGHRFLRPLFDLSRDQRSRRPRGRGFQVLRVGPGVHVGLHLPNTPHYVVCFFGVLMAGGRVVNLNPLSGAGELKSQIGDADVRLMVTLDLPGLHSEIAALKGTALCETLELCSTLAAPNRISAVT